MVKRTQERINFLAGVITTAVEGGINYWAATREYRWGSEKGLFKFGEGEYASVEIQDLESELEWKEPWHKVTVDTIARGINKILSPDFQINDEIRQWIRDDNRDNDGCMIDSTAADCIVQAALFGRLVYG